MVCNWGFESGLEKGKAQPAERAHISNFWFESKIDSDWGRLLLIEGQIK